MNKLLLWSTPTMIAAALALGCERAEPREDVVQAEPAMPDIAPILEPSEMGDVLFEEDEGEQAPDAAALQTRLGELDRRIADLAGAGDPQAAARASELRAAWTEAHRAIEQARLLPAPEQARVLRRTQDLLRALDVHATDAAELYGVAER